MDFQIVFNTFSAYKFWLQLACIIKELLAYVIKEWL